MRKELNRLYTVENKTIREVGKILGIAEQTVFQRIQRLGIVSTPYLKKGYSAKRREDIIIPKSYSPDLAEFFGIMLGDGNLSFYQVIVTLGTKEYAYAEYIVRLMKGLFGVAPKIGIRKTGYKNVYVGSVALSHWLKDEGLVYNKVRAQVSVPEWIFEKSQYLERLVRGFFDTDGSVYRLRFGVQISFTNRSLPLLKGIHRACKFLDYHPSHISGFRFYITKRPEIIRFFQEIQPKNPKHGERFEWIMNELGR
ncbi:MAG: LAGLIDADG family homing endonuclease [bacterium]|nr:LAGLIDADG family homing endonuclease [bacterium]